MAWWLEQLADGLHRIALMLILNVQTRWYSTHQMLRKLFSFCFLFHIYNNNNSLSIGWAIQYHKLLSTLLLSTKTCVHLSLLMMTGLQSPWSWSGSNLSVPPLWKFLLQRGQCFYRLLPSFVTSRTPFTKLFALFPTTLPQNSKKVLSKPTSNLATTMGRQIAHLTMSGHVVGIYIFFCCFRSCSLYLSSWS